MAQVKIWVLSRMIGGGVDEETGDPCGAWLPEASVIASNNGIHTTEVLGSDVPHPTGLAITSHICTPAQANTLHGLAKYEVLAARYTGDESNGEDANTAVPGWEPDVLFTTARWNSLRDSLVPGFFAASVIDNWYAANPTATPRDVKRKLVQLSFGHTADANEAGV